MPFVKSASYTDMTNDRLRQLKKLQNIFLTAVCIPEITCACVRIFNYMFNFIVSWLKSDIYISLFEFNFLVIRLIINRQYQVVDGWIILRRRIWSNMALTACERAPLSIYEKKKKHCDLVTLPEAVINSVGDLPPLKNKAKYHSSPMHLKLMLLTWTHKTKLVKISLS